MHAMPFNRLLAFSGVTGLQTGCAVALLALLPDVRCGAANIVWDAPAPISSETDVSTTGALLYAFSFGGSGVSPTTVNGVTFGSFAAPNGGRGGAAAGTVTLNLLDAADYFRTTVTETGATTAPFSNLSAAYQGLLRSAVSDGWNPSHMTLTLGGLTIGNRYELQFWSNESTSFTNYVGNNTRTILTAGNAASLDGNGTDDIGGLGQWVMGRFTADALSQAIDITGGNPAGASPILSAFQVRNVPEPASLSLLGLGAILAASRRHRTY